MNDALQRRLRADVAGRLHADLDRVRANALKTVPGVRVVSGVRAGEGQAFGSRISVTGVAPDISEGDRRQLVQGQPADAGHARPRRRVRLEGLREGHSISSDGSPIVVETPTGAKLHLKLRGIFDAAEGRIAVRRRHDLDEAVRPRRTRTRRTSSRSSTSTGGVTPANTARLNAALKDFPDAKIQTESQFKANQQRGIDHAAAAALRAALALDHRQPVRDREHARADGVRADARARHAARGRNDAAYRCGG